MARSLTYIFPASNAIDVCKLQSLTGAGNLTLNGNLANPTKTSVSFNDNGYVRSVIITSNSVANRIFTIKGSQNGANISEDVAVALGANTEESTNAFDIIYSISVNGAATNVTVGSGYFGFMKLIGLNLERDVINYALSTAKLTATSIPTGLYQVFSDIANNAHTYADIVANNYNIVPIDTGTHNQYILPLTDPTIVESVLCKGWLLAIDGTVATAANSIQLNFIQT